MCEDGIELTLGSCMCEHAIWDPTPSCMCEDVITLSEIQHRHTCEIQHRYLRSNTVTNVHVPTRYLRSNTVTNLLAYTWFMYRSRMRSDLKCLDLQIYPISGRIFQVTGTPFTRVKICFKSWGLPWKRVEYVRGLKWQLVGNFGGRNYFESDLLHLWCVNLTYTWLIHTLGSYIHLAHTCENTPCDFHCKTLRQAATHCKTLQHSYMCEHAI